MSTRVAESADLASIRLQLALPDPIREVSDPKLKGIADRVVKTVRLAGEKAVLNVVNPKAYPLPDDKKSFEHILLSRLRSLPGAKQQAASTKTLAYITAAPARAGFFAQSNGIDVSKVDLHSKEAIEKQVHDLGFPSSLRIDEKQLTSLSIEQLMPVSPSLTGAVGLFPAFFPHLPPFVLPKPPQQDAKKLEFRIHSVRCADETGGGWGGEWGGEDNIYLGATTVDESGDTEKVSQFKVGEFDDGDVVSYATPRSLTTFSLTEGTDWPKSYFVTLVLAEVDSGGLADFLNNLLEKVKEKVIAYLAATIGGIVGSSGGLIGAAIGIAVGYAVGKIFEWLKAWWGDDIFQPQTASVHISSYKHSWAGRLDSPEGVLRYSGHDGLYEVKYDWRLTA